jgi:hypothetical protein
MTGNVLPLSDLPHNVIAKTARDAAFTLEQYNALDARWWVDHGITAGGIFKVPDYLPIMHQKLATAEAEDRLSDFSLKDSASFVAAHVARLLEAYAQDETRDPTLLAKIKRAVIDRPGVANLSKLIALGNQAAKGKYPEGQYPKLNTADQRDVGDALLLILERSIPADASEAQQAAQFEQDMQHVEVLEILREGLRPRRDEAMRRRIGD